MRFACALHMHRQNLIPLSCLNAKPLELVIKNVFQHCTMPPYHKINLFKRPFWASRFEYGMCLSSVVGLAAGTQHGLNGKLQLGDDLACIKNSRYKRDYAAKNIAFAPAILSVAGKIHPECLRFLWVLADMQTVKYFNLIGDEEDIGNDHFKWSPASTFSYNRNVIGLAVAYASAIRTHCRYMVPLTP